MTMPIRESDRIREKIESHVNEFKSVSGFSDKFIEYANKIVFVQCDIGCFENDFYVFNFIELSSRLISVTSLHETGNFLLPAEKTFVCRYNVFDNLIDKREYEKILVLNEYPAPTCSYSEWRSLVAFYYGRNEIERLYDLSPNCYSANNTRVMTCFC